MKQKLIISGVCLALVLSLIACGGQQAQEPQQPEDVQPSEVVISEPPVEAQPMEAKQEATPTAPPVEESQGVEDGDETPEGAGYPEGQEPATLDVELFTDVNETVYATGTVNIRASWTANSEKLGSMGTGESVTRTGTPIAGTEAEGWSRVCLADGTIAYISTSYLSTTKPQTQAPATQAPATQAPATQAPATNTTKTTNTTQTQQPTSQGGGPGIIDNGLSGGETGGPDGQGLAGMLQWSEEHPLDYSDEDYLRDHPGSYIGETGNIVDPNIAVNMN